MRLSNTMLHYSLFRQLKHMEGSNSETSLEPRPTWVLGYCETFIEKGKGELEVEWGVCGGIVAMSLLTSCSTEESVEHYDNMHT